MFGVIMPLCNRMFCCIFGWFSLSKSGWNMKKLFCCPALELFHCLPLLKTVLFVSSRAFLLSTTTFSLSTPVENSEATWKKATKCNKHSLSQRKAVLASVPCLGIVHKSYIFFTVLHVETWRSIANVLLTDRFPNSKGHIATLN